MRFLSLGRRVGAKMAVVAVFCVVPFTYAIEPERVRFTTADQAEIHGTFYGSNKGQKAPCVILLHNPGLDSQQTGWGDLAKKLQEKDFAVLTFDFRGHGDSVNVGQNFYTIERTNQSFKSFRRSKKNQISYKDFTTSANTVSMVNDIAAAKRFLDIKNDSGECNSSRTVVVGAGGGATLGAAWIANEWKRRAVRTGFPIVTNNTLEGEDIAAAVWLSITPSAGTSGARWSGNVQNYLGGQVRDNVPMLFLYGDQDTASAQFAKSLHTSMTRGDKSKNPKLQHTLETGLKDTKLSGHGLLGKPSLNTEDKIVTYITKVMEDRAGKPWAKKEVDKTVLSAFPINLYAR